MERKQLGWGGSSYKTIYSDDVGMFYKFYWRPDGYNYHPAKVHLIDVGNGFVDLDFKQRNGEYEYRVPYQSIFFVPKSCNNAYQLEIVNPECMKGFDWHEDVWQCLPDIDEEEIECPSAAKHLFMKSAGRTSAGDYNPFYVEKTIFSIETNDIQLTIPQKTQIAGVDTAVNKCFCAGLW